MLGGERVAFLCVTRCEEKRDREDGVENCVLEEADDGVASDAWRDAVSAMSVFMSEAKARYLHAQADSFPG